MSHYVLGGAWGLGQLRTGTMYTKFSIQFQGHLSRGMCTVTITCCEVRWAKWGTPTWHLVPSKQTNYKTQSPDEPQTKKHTKAVEASRHHHYRVYPPSYNNIIISTKGTCNKHTHGIHKMHIFAQYLLSALSLSLSPLPQCVHSIQTD